MKSKYTKIENTVDANSAYNKFFSTYIHIFNKNFKYIKKIPRRKIPRQEWITSGLINCCRTKSKLYRNYKRHPNLLNESIYKKYRNKLKSVLKRRKDFYSNKLKLYSNDLRQFWKILNNLIRGQSHNKIALDFNYKGDAISDPVMIVEKFNEFFTNIGCELASKIPKTQRSFSSYLKGSYNESFVLFSTTPF